MPTSVLRSVSLFMLAALAEIGGAWLVWQGVHDQRGLLWVGPGSSRLALMGSWRPSNRTPNFGRVLAAYGGIFVAGSPLWGVVADGFRPDRWDFAGAAVCILGVALIMYAPRG